MWIIPPADKDENGQTKLRSLMIKSIAGKREFSQREVSRLLLSEPLYHSDFQYVSLITDLNTQEINTNKYADSEDSA